MTRARGWPRRLRVREARFRGVRQLQAPVVRRRTRRVDTVHDEVVRTGALTRRRLAAGRARRPGGDRMRAAGGPEACAVVGTGAGVGVLHGHLDAVGGRHRRALLGDGGGGDVHVRCGVEFEAVVEPAVDREGAPVRPAGLQPHGGRGARGALDDLGVLGEGVGGRARRGDRLGPAPSPRPHPPPRTAPPPRPRPAPCAAPSRATPRHVARTVHRLRRHRAQSLPGPSPILPRRPPRHPRNAYPRPKQASPAHLDLPWQAFPSRRRTTHRLPTPSGHTVRNRPERPRQHKTPTASAAGVCSETAVGTHEPVGTESVASVHRSCSARSAWIWRYTRSPPMAASATRRSFFTVRPRLSLT